MLLERELQREKQRVNDLLNRVQSQDWQTYVNVSSATSDNQKDEGYAPRGMSDEEELRRIGQSTLPVGEPIFHAEMTPEDITDTLVEMGLTEHE